MPAGRRRRELLAYRDELPVLSAVIHKGMCPRPQHLGVPHGAEEHSVIPAINDGQRVAVEHGDGVGEYRHRCLLALPGGDAAEFIVATAAVPAEQASQMGLFFVQDGGRPSACSQQHRMEHSPFSHANGDDRRFEGYASEAARRHAEDATGVPDRNDADTGGEPADRVLVCEPASGLAPFLIGVADLRLGPREGSWPC